MQGGLGAKHALRSLACSSCHLQAGTKAGALALTQTADHYPEFNKRAKRVIALNERIAMCFLNSLNGSAPTPQSPQMLALVKYIESLRGTAPAARRGARRATASAARETCQPFRHCGARVRSTEARAWRALRSWLHGCAPTCRRGLKERFPTARRSMSPHTSRPKNDRHRKSEQVSALPLFECLKGYGKSGGPTISMP